MSTQFRIVLALASLVGLSCLATNQTAVAQSDPRQRCRDRAKSDFDYTYYHGCRYPFRLGSTYDEGMAPVLACQDAAEREYVGRLQYCGTPDNARNIGPDPGFPDRELRPRVRDHRTDGGRPVVRDHRTRNR